MAVGASVVFAGCRSTTDVDATQAAGVYALTTVSGRGPATGHVVLSADGSAERSVRYAATGGTASPE